MAGTKTKESPNIEALHIQTRACKSCGICVAFCPRGVLDLDSYGMPKISHPEKCNNCLTCDILCPDFAITGMRKRKSAK